MRGKSLFKCGHPLPLAGDLGLNEKNKASMAPESMCFSLVPKEYAMWSADPCSYTCLVMAGLTPSTCEPKRTFLSRSCFWPGVFAIAVGKVGDINYLSESPLKGDKPCPSPNSWKPRRANSKVDRNYRKRTFLISKLQSKEKC